MKQVKFAVKNIINHYCQHFSYYINKPFCFPTVIHFAPTKRCNLRCRYCNIWKEGEIKNELDTKTWEKFLDDLHDWVGDTHVGVTGGEPLLRRDIFDILEYMKKLGFNISLTTNGILLNKEIIGKLLPLEPFNINISLDSLNPEEHDFFRGVSSFKKTYQNILHLKEELNKNKSATKLVVETALTKKNISNINKLVDFCMENYLKIHFGNIVANLTIDYKGDFKSESEYKPEKEDREKIIRGFNYLNRIQEKTNMIVNSSSELNLIKGYYLGKKIRFVCVGNVRNLFVDADGSVKLCSYTPSVGNIKQSNVKEIWYSKKADDTRKFMKKCKKICQFDCYKKRSLFENYQVYKSLYF